MTVQIIVTTSTRTMTARLVRTVRSLLRRRFLRTRRKNFMRVGSFRTGGRPAPRLLSLLTSPAPGGALTRPEETSLERGFSDSTFVPGGSEASGQDMKRPRLVGFFLHG